MLFTTALTATVFSAYGVSLKAADGSKNEAYQSTFTYDDYNTGYNTTATSRYYESEYGSYYGYSFDDSEAPEGDVYHYWSSESPSGEIWSGYTVKDGATGKKYNSYDNGQTWTTYDENWNAVASDVDPLNN